jgi:anaerobic magnesium-protoporphyrin IX monomethyl ester cyclase
MKILIVIHDLFQSTNLMQLGPAYLAAVARQEGYEVDICSQDVYHFCNEYLADLIKKNKYNLVGIGFLAARYYTVKKICQDIRSALDEHGGKIILGGHGPTPIAEFVLKDTGADIVALGEAEATLLKLLEALSRSSDLSKVDGIAYRVNEEVFLNPRSHELYDINKLPLPARDLFPMDVYSAAQGYAGVDTGRSATMLTSRGCPYSCNFCYRMEKGIRLRSLESVMEEIKQLQRDFSIDTIYFDDELMMSSQNRMQEFCELVLKLEKPLRWNCNGRVNIVNSKLLKIMKRAGCFFINYGLESVDQKVLDTMDKKITVEQILSAARATRDSGIGSGLNIIFGHINDTVDNLWKGAEVIRKYNTYDQCRTIRPVTPYPGSGLYNFAIKTGKLKGPADFFEKFKNSDLYMVNFTGIPEKEIYENLFEVNQLLVNDYYLQKARETINGFNDLYFKGDINFRGAR